MYFKNILMYNQWRLCVFGVIFYIIWFNVQIWSLSVNIINLQTWSFLMQISIKTKHKNHRYFKSCTSVSRGIRCKICLHGKNNFSNAYYSNWRLSFLSNFFFKDMEMVAYIKTKGIAIECMKIDFHNWIDVDRRIEREWFIYCKRQKNHRLCQ